MVRIRKKPIDSIDRAILRFMNGARRDLSGNQIAKKVYLSPPAIRPRLNNLQRQGIIKPIKIGNPRVFSRNFPKKVIRIKAPSKILWNLDLRKKKRR